MSPRWAAGTRGSPDLQCSFLRADYRQRALRSWRVWFLNRRLESFFPQFFFLVLLIVAQSSGEPSSAEINIGHPHSPHEHIFPPPKFHRRKSFPQSVLAGLEVEIRFTKIQDVQEIKFP